MTESLWDFMSNKRGLLTLILMVLIVSVSGCVSNEVESLDQGFETGHTEIDLDSEPDSVLNQSLSKNYSRYSVKSELKVLMKTPVAPMRANLSSEGFYNNSHSVLKTVTKLGFGIGPEIEESQYPVKKVETYSNRTETEILNMENSSKKTQDRLGRKELGVSVAAVKEIKTENITVLGATGENSSQLLLRIKPNKTDLLKNYAEIFEKHGIADNSSTSIKEKEEFSGFEKAKAYAWIDRETMKLERFSYYGSVADKKLQVRTEIFFTHENS